MTDAIAQFLSVLEKGPANCDGVFNPWRDSDARDARPIRGAPKLRIDNLRAYIEARARNARVMLMGEAPSHRGCRFTGIAFSSEVELVHKRDLVAHRALALTSRDAATKPMRERSAAVIWDEIARAGAAYDVVLWNAFPWHPYSDAVTTNRKPRLGEVAHGRAALRALLDCFTHPLEIFAVGKVAEDALARWEEFECAGYIRHPSQGGESRFREGFRRLVAARL
ncbi:MAG: uracil-DNA glycosylase [Bacillota bacterium]